MGCCGECGKMKATVWVFWGVNTFVSVLFSGLALSSFSAINTGVDAFQMNSQEKSIYKNSLLASTMLGFLMVLFFIVFSFLVLISRTFGDFKLAYGVMLGTCLHTAWFLLLAALVLQNSDDNMRVLRDAGVWGKNDYTTYQATYVFCYILVAFYLVAFFILLFGRRHLGKVDDEQGMGSGRNASGPVNVYLDMASMSKNANMRPNQV